MKILQVNADKFICKYRRPLLTFQDLKLEMCLSLNRFPAMFQLTLVTKFHAVILEFQIFIQRNVFLHIYFFCFSIFNCLLDNGVGLQVLTTLITARPQHHIYNSKYDILYCNRPYLESAIFEMCIISIFILVSFERKK